MTMEQMIQGDIGIMVKFGMSEEEAKAMVTKQVPTLKRWKQ
jgi:hypothetical protein